MAFRPRVAAFSIGVFVLLPSAFTAHAASVKLGWDAVPETDIQGYRVYVGTQSQQYEASYDTAADTSFDVNDLADGQTYYFAVSAVGSTGLEGPLSEELVVNLMAQQSVAVADSYSTPRNVTLVVPDSGVLANDLLFGPEPFIAMLNSEPQHGTLSLNESGGFHYVPDPDFTGSDSFTYHANGSNVNSNIVSVEITVHAPTSAILVNGSFEADFSGWMNTGSALIKSSAPYTATDGSQLVAFNADNLAPSGVISQSFASVVGETYVLDFDVGVLAENLNAQTILVTVTGEENLLSEAVTINGNGASTAKWESQSFSFVANSTTTTLTFRDQSATTGSVDLLLDNVKLAVLPPAVVTPPVAIGSTALSGTPGAMVISMAAVNPGSYALERSQDLVNWEVVSEIQILEPGPLEFHDNAEPEPGTDRMFYRIGSTAFNPGS